MNGKASYDYIPALDGFRAISIALVLLSHAGLQTIVPGGLGVLVFFVISGFLLTRQMIVEIEGSGGLNIRRFYLRRLFRLAPALLVYIIIFTVIMKGMGAIITPVHVFSGLFYFANYYSIFVGYPPDSPFPILWSLAVEEHYYIVFPFFISAFRKNLRKTLPWLGLMVIAVLAWRFTVATTCTAEPMAALCGIPGGERIFHGTDTMFDCILYGAVAALALHYHNAAMHRLLIHRNAFLLALTMLLGTLLYRDPLFRDTLRFSLQSASVAVIIINVLFGPGMAGKMRRILSHPAFLLAGRLSYSLYLFHFGVMILLDAMHMDIDPRHPAALCLYFSGTGICAVCSYFFVEKPMVAIRKHFGSHNKS